MHVGAPRAVTAKLQLIKIYKIASSIGSTLFLSIYHYVKVYFVWIFFFIYFFKKFYDLFVFFLI
jgi:hypothetical protein